MPLCSGALPPARFLVVLGTLSGLASMGTLRRGACGRASFVGFLVADFVGFGLAQFFFRDFFLGDRAFGRVFFYFFAFEFAFQRFFEGEGVGDGRSGSRIAMRGGCEEERGQEEEDGEDGEAIGHGRIHRLRPAHPLAKSGYFDTLHPQ
jgi:hypothetical protein